MCVLVPKLLPDEMITVAYKMPAVHADIYLSRREAVKIEVHLLPGKVLDLLQSDDGGDDADEKDAVLASQLAPMIQKVQLHLSAKGLLCEHSEYQEVFGKGQHPPCYQLTKLENDDA